MRDRLRPSDLPQPVIDAMNELLERGMDHALEVMRRRDATLRAMADALLENSTMSGEDITAV